MRHLSVRRVALAIAVSIAVSAAAAACGSGGPTPPATPWVYFLKTIDGKGLPVVIYATTAGDTITVLGEGLSLAAGGHATRSRTIRRVVAGGAATVTTSSAPYLYQVSGSHITLQPQCPPRADCISGETGSITAGALLLDVAGPDGTSTWSYTRIGPD